MKKTVLCLLSFLWLTIGIAQQEYGDSLKQSLKTNSPDSTRIATLASLSSYYGGLYPDSGLYYADTLITLSVANNDKYGEAVGTLSKGLAILKQGDFTSSIQLGFKCLNLSNELREHKLLMLSKANSLIGDTYAVSGNPEKAVQYLHQSIGLLKQSGEFSNDECKNYFSLAFTMLLQEKKDSARFYLNKGWSFFSADKNNRNIEPYIVSGNVTRFLGQPEKAEEYFRKGIELAKKYNSLFFVAAISNDLANFFVDKGMKDSCLKYMHQCLSLSQRYHYRIFEIYSSNFLYYFYESLNKDSSFKYLKIYVTANDEVFSQEKMKQFQAASFEQEIKEKDIEEAKTKYRNRQRMTLVISAAIVFLIIAFILYRNNRQKQKANVLLDVQKKKVEDTLSELKSTQAQLIQSEKMASLGQLTAGIAHEIQNPLNFVNNFSEINNELIEEIRRESSNVNREPGSPVDREILNDIFQNNEKITLHGKRADAIVKGMLEHSRQGIGQKQLTDINALADEYLKLAYHGMLAKNKEFNLTMQTDFDNNIGKMNIIPQDIGRVLLNIYSNAFYAALLVPPVGGGFRESDRKHIPTVSVTTKKEGNNVLITVQDNGPGIPEAIIDKIFQPFFTTKPTGQGTGLGLSLAYDIVKAHGGELKAESTENKGATFTIVLPVSQA